MITITDTDVKNLKMDLINSLTILSNGKLDQERAKMIADRSVDNIDLANSALLHKGTNWYAKEILRSLKI